MILDEIVSSSQRRAADLPGSFHSSTHIPVSLKDAILKGRTTHTRPVIAELKFASPSRGIIRPVKNPVEMATDMVQGGCCALSVLTEPEFFSGCPTTIQAIRDQVTVPILRKDFIVQEHQLDETRALGADAVLLITGILGEDTGYFVDEAIKRGLEPLLLKPIDESRVIWLASAIKVKRIVTKEKGRKRDDPNVLSLPMQGRFGVKVGTMFPSDAELTQWIKDRCKDW